MIFSIDAEKAFDKIQHQFMIKALTKVTIGGTYLSIIKAIYNKPTVNIILNAEKPKAFLLKCGTRQRCPTFTTFIQHSIESPSPSIRPKKKSIQIGGEEVKLLLYADEIIPYIENPYTIQTDQRI